MRMGLITITFLFSIHTFIITKIRQNSPLEKVNHNHEAVHSSVQIVNKDKEVLAVACSWDGDSVPSVVTVTLMGLGDTSGAVGEQQV